MCTQGVMVDARRVVARAQWRMRSDPQMAAILHGYPCSLTAPLASCKTTLYTHTPAPRRSSQLPEKARQPSPTSTTTHWVPYAGLRVRTLSSMRAHSRDTAA